MRPFGTCPRNLLRPVPVTCLGCPVTCSGRRPHREWVRDRPRPGGREVVRRALTRQPSGASRRGSPGAKSGFSVGKPGRRRCEGRRDDGTERLSPREAFSHHEERLSQGDRRGRAPRRRRHGNPPRFPGRLAGSGQVAAERFRPRGGARRPRGLLRRRRPRDHPDDRGREPREADHAEWADSWKRSTARGFGWAGSRDRRDGFRRRIRWDRSALS